MEHHYWSRTFRLQMTDLKKKGYVSSPDSRGPPLLAMPLRTDGNRIPLVITLRRVRLPLLDGMLWTLINVGAED